MRKVIQFLAWILFLASLPLAAAAEQYAADEPDAERPPFMTIELSDPAQCGGSYGALDHTFQASDGKTYRTIVGAVPECVQNAFLDTLASNFALSSSVPIKIVHNGFIDAEKWDCEDGDPWSDELQDSALCWGATLSNILWSSGWAQRYTNPKTGSSFASEDELFTYVSDYFMNAGGEVTIGLDWFFDGVYLADGISGSPWIESDEDRAFAPELLAEKLYHKYDLIADPSQISILETYVSGDPVAFGASVGHLLNGIAEGSEHALTAVGIIMDPEEDSLSERYQAILLADSDNDAHPDAGADIVSDAERIEDRSRRPNSYTVYPLRLIEDRNGTACWEIVGYSTDPCLLYDIQRLAGPTEEVIRNAAETEGSCNAFSQPDLCIRNLIMTNEYSEDALHEDIPFTEFASGESVYASFRLQNKGYHEFEPEETHTVEIRFTLQKDACTVDRWSVEKTIPSVAPIWVKLSVKLPAESLKKGDYQLQVEVNPAKDGKRPLFESYCGNNRSDTVCFAIDGGGEASPVSPETEDPYPILLCVCAIWIALSLGVILFRRTVKVKE